jgi:hypothetical protein
MDYGQFSDDLVADTDPTNPTPDPDDDLGSSGHAEDPVPVCARCGSEIGIFLKVMECEQVKYLCKEHLGLDVLISLPKPPPR